MGFRSTVNPVNSYCIATRIKSDSDRYFHEQTDIYIYIYIYIYITINLHQRIALFAFVHTVFVFISQ